MGHHIRAAIKFGSERQAQGRGAVTTTPHASSAAAYTQDAVEAYHRGMEYLDYNEPDHAIAAFSEAIRLHGKHANTWFARGFAYANRGHLAEAVADYTEAIRLDPAYAAAYHNRAAAYRELGDLGNASADEAKVRQLRAGTT